MRFLHVCFVTFVTCSHHVLISRRTKTYIWNIEDLENPVLVNTYIGPETSIDHNQYIRDDLVSNATRKKHMTLG